MDAWEALWAKERKCVEDSITKGGFGKSADGKTVTGPGGFSMDLTKCAAGWSDTEGLTDTTIKIGQTISLSGTLAEYGNIAKSAQVFFDYYSAKGAFKDSTGKTRSVQYIVKDDAYDASKTIPLVDELIDSEKVFDMWTLGSPNTLKTYDKTNQRCIPDAEAMTGHSAWADPVNHPWTTGAPAPSYSTEAVLWGGFLEQHISEFPTDRKVKVASLVINNDFGHLYDNSFKAYLATSSVLKDRIEYTSETVEASAPTITDPMTTLAAKNPDVFIAMLAGTSCTQAVTEAANNGMHDKVKYLFQPETCSGTAFVKKDKVGGDGSASNGWWIVNPGGRDITDPTFKDDAFVKFARDLLNSKGINPDSSSLYGIGIGYVWPFIQFLIIAGDLPGGLTRTNFILAQRAINMTDPVALPGVHFHMNGNQDAYFVEAGVFQQWDSAQQRWITKSNIIDLDGHSGLCAWNSTKGLCG